MKSLTPAAIEQCKRATSVPYNLRIDKMWWDGGDIETNHQSSMRKKKEELIGEWSQSKSESEDMTSADTRGSGLFTMRTVHVVLTLLDQYHWPLSECAGCKDVDVGSKSIVVATASIPKGGGLDVNGGIGDLSGLKTNTSLHGIVEFHSLRFTASGEYDLKFHLNRNTQLSSSAMSSSLGSKATQLIRVKVEAHEDDGLGPLGQCGRKLYSYLSSFMSDSPKYSSSNNNNKNNHVEEGGGDDKRIELGDKFALIDSVYAINALNLFPPIKSRDHPTTEKGTTGDKESNSSSSATTTTSSSSSSTIEDSSVVTCADILSSADIRIQHGWGGSLLVRYRPVVFALDRGERLPSSMLDPCERLGIPSTNCAKEMPSPKVVRSAYYKASLLWHPDRWATFSDPFQRAAQDQFELISESYRALGGGNGKQSSSTQSSSQDNEGRDTILYL
jgi:hypothetical protein